MEQNAADVAAVNLSHAVDRASGCLEVDKHSFLSLRFSIGCFVCQNYEHSDNDCPIVEIGKVSNFSYSEPRGSVAKLICS